MGQEARVQSCGDEGVAVLPLNHIFKFDGMRVAWGKIGTGEPIVLIHGTPFSSQVWHKIAPLLANKYAVYFYDLLGYGQSDMAEGGDVSLGMQNNLLAALFAHWNLTRPEVLCHDFGGATALRSYYLNGLRFKRLTIFDAVALSPWGSPFVQHVRKYESAFSGLPSYAHDALLAAYIQGAAHLPLRADALKTYMMPWQGPTGQGGFYRQIAQMDQKYTDEVQPLYAALDCPTKILWGANDEWIPVSKGQELANIITDGELRIIPSAGHLLQEDAPEAIIATVFG